MINKQTFYMGLRGLCQHENTTALEEKLNQKGTIDKILKENSFENFYQVEELFEFLGSMRVSRLIFQKQETSSYECPECGHYTKSSDSDENDTKNLWFDIYFNPDYKTSTRNTIYLGGVNFDWNESWFELYSIWTEFEHQGQELLIKLKKYGNN